MKRLVNVFILTLMFSTFIDAKTFRCASQEDPKNLFAVIDIGPQGATKVEYSSYIVGLGERTGVEYITRGYWEKFGNEYILISEGTSANGNSFGRIKIVTGDKKTTLTARVDGDTRGIFTGGTVQYSCDLIEIR